MNTHFRGAALRLIAALAPLSMSAQDLFGIEFSDVTLRAFASVATQRKPIKTATDTGSAPRADPNDVGVLLRARGVPFIHLGVAAAIPEPTTWTLLAAGLRTVRFAARARVRR